MGWNIIELHVIQKKYLFQTIGTIPEKISDEKPSPKQDPEKTKPKPKLKSIKQTEVEESSLEKLKRLENGKLKSKSMNNTDSHGFAIYYTSNSDPAFNLFIALRNCRKTRGQMYS